MPIKVEKKKMAQHCVSGEGMTRLIRGPFFCTALFLLAGLYSACVAAESLPPLREGKPPQTLDELWGGYDPRAEPLEAKTLEEWEQDGVVCRVIRYSIGTFKGCPATMVGFYAFPKGGTKLPGLLHLHGGGQSASLDEVVVDAKRGYASLSLNWGGNSMNLGRNRPAYEGQNTDWGSLDATHPPQRNKANHFAGPLQPDDDTLDAVESPRNSNWFLVLIAARRGITFLEEQPEVDAEKIGVYGHSMGGRLTTDLAAIDKRVRAAVPSCGGAGSVLFSQEELPGCVKSSPSALELACVCDNPYISRLNCPILWLSPTNDFHGAIDNMAITWKSVPDEKVRFSITPHHNHRHADEFKITQYLWFEEHLKGGFGMPASPVAAVDLKAADGVPVVTVAVDQSRPAKGVAVYYSTDPQVRTRFWQSAQTVAHGDRWQAACPLVSLDEPFFAFANVTYEVPTEYRRRQVNPGQHDTDVFTISSRMVSVSSATLRAAGARATEEPDRLIDDGVRPWQDWFQINWDHAPLWRAYTRKLNHPKWRGPEKARLAFDIRCLEDNELVIEVETNGWSAFEAGKPAIRFATVKQLKGSPDWQTVSVSLEDLNATDTKIGTPLAHWRSVTQLGIGPSGEVVKKGEKVSVDGKRWEGPREIRNLRWE